MSRRQALCLVLVGVAAANALVAQDVQTPPDVQRNLAAAAKGDPDAQYRLGVLYQTGRGVRKDLKEAAKWYRLAANQGKAYAQMNLGMMYFDGEGIPQDKNEGVKLFTAAANRGDAMAQRRLGILNYTGDSIAQDYKAALRWYLLAAQQGRRVGTNGSRRDVY